MYDTAVSHALLRSVAASGSAEGLRLYAPDQALLFSSLDARRPGYDEAVGIARDFGFEPVQRLAGGHAAAFLESSMAFAWASPDEAAHLHIQARFEKLVGWIVDALRDLGLDARVGEIPGEYCPGEYSVNIAGRVKVMGVGQRVIRGGAHVGGVLTIAHTEQLQAVLIPIYEALGLDFHPPTAGGVADFDSSLTLEDVIEALTWVLSSDGYVIKETEFPSSITNAAEALAPLHGPHREPGAAAALRPSRTQFAGKAIVHSDDSDHPQSDSEEDES